MALRSLTPVAITALPNASTPLSGTEAVAVVQSGTTSQVAVSDLTAGRAVSASALTASSGNLTFSGTAQRITGDFSNATAASRVMFQSSTTNGATQLSTLPNGTGTQSGLFCFDSSDTVNNSWAAIRVISATDARLQSSTTGTGTYLPMTFYTGGSERMRIDTSGNVGIGTASPATRLHILSAGDGTFNSQVIIAPAAGANPAKITFNPTVSSAIAGLTDGSVAFYGNGANTERMRIDSSGNVGIGTASPGSKLGIAWSTNAGINLSDGTVTGVIYNTSGNSMGIGTTTNHPVAIYANNSERMRIDASGNVGIGTASPTAALDVVGAAIFTRNGKPLVLNPDYVSAGTHANISTGTGMALAFSTNGDSNERMRITSAGNIVAGASAALATNATDGFLYVPTCAGTPTGTPTAITGMAPIVVNTTNNKLYFYSGGAWRDAGP